jgi:hypothetical protein
MELSKKNENNRIYKEKRTPEEEIKNKNPWYICDQIEAAQKHAKPAIQRRYCFIFGSIKR